VRRQSRASRFFRDPSRDLITQITPIKNIAGRSRQIVPAPRWKSGAENESSFQPEPKAASLSY